MNGGTSYRSNSTQRYFSHLKKTTRQSVQNPRDLFKSESDYQVRAPTHIIWGEWDRALLAGNLNGIEKYVPQLTLCRIPDATHWIVQEKPSLIVEHIRGALGA
jgi:pimeloyl-ACP methyl ester carboxylesterase